MLESGLLTPMEKTEKQFYEALMKLMNTLLTVFIVFHHLTGQDKTD